MTTTNMRFVARNGLDNNGNSITNLGVASASLALAGANALTLTTTGTTNVTLPTSGTLLTTAGTAALATSISGGATGNVSYQSAASTTAFVTNAAGVLQALTSGAVPTWTTTPTLTGTNFSGTATSLSIGGSAPAGSLTGATLAAGVTASSLTSVGTLTSLAMSGALTLNNATYLYAKNTTGTAGRIAGINASNALYIGDIDNVGNGTINVTVSGVQPLTISSTGIAVTGTVTGTSFNSITGLSSTTPAALGTAAVGTGTTVARADHVHQSPTTITGNAGTATSIAGGAATQVPFQSGAGATAFSSDLVFDNTAKTLTVGGATPSGYPVIIGGSANSIYQGTGTTNSLILRSLAGNHVRVYTDYGTGATRGGDFIVQLGGSDTGIGGNIRLVPGQSVSGVSGAIRMLGSVEYLMGSYGLSGAYTIDFALSGMYQDISLVGNTTLTFANPVTGNWGEYTFRLAANPTAYTLTWPASVTWETGTAPIIPATGSTTIRLISIDGGVTYLGSVVGNSTVTNDTTTNATYYPTLATVTAGPSIVKVSSTKLSFNPSTGVLSSTTFSGAHSGSGAGLTSIPNGALTNSSVTVGSTSIALGASATTIAGLTSVTSTTFVGALTGNASTATMMAGGVANQIPYQTAANTSSFITAPSVSSTFLQWTGSAFAWAAAGGGFSSTDDTTTNATYYPAVITSAGGSTAKTSSTKLTFNPSTGTLSSTVFNSLSDARAKTNIRALGYGLNDVLKMVGHKYEMIDGGQTSIGLVAQEVQDIVPEVVSKNTDGMLGINYPVLTAVLIEAIKDLTARLAILEAKV
jgi:hypothetical protein